ncbi:FTR1 family iron permease [Roseospira marina]|uniref:FTR1 family iron permease n=1 Tax=Roseospira marina TaxID=140057 RepID=A0A5M6ICM3_9PROT|nr:FTR1 family protein [Roseospira marina]KAA5606024.1 FTR1 family iron permease [Roseospira marina]MBB4313118.1 high-affinity iron transporter [Roseospira marina]MBB5086141.1 high-affinity iron transporter [Roseospira marina]
MRMLTVIFLCVLGLAGPVVAADAPDYRSLVDRIDVLLEEARDAYASGDVEAAKTAVQRSYFELFENLEGPIRVNVSAQRSYELEAEFGDIRQLIIDGAPVEQVTRRIDDHVAALDALVPTLEEGFVLRAEPTVGDTDETASTPAPEAPALPQTVEPYWEQAVASIRADLNAAADALDAGDPEEAKRLIQQAQFEGYKNSLLETAIRRHVSQRQDIAYNAEFTRILGLVEDGREARLIRGSARVMAEEMTSQLPGLPLVGAAKERAEAMPEPQIDWAAVADQVNAAVDEAITRAGAGEVNSAISLLQDTYFDVFEASGMEGRIGARDPAFKATLEGHFSKLMALARAGASTDAMAAEAEAMRADLDDAVTLLDPTGSGSGWLALFGYALLIILREGFEAILIVTAIMAYLVKTGHRDKQGVIVNSVVVALLASVVTAVLLKLVFQASAASQEVLEGATMLLAAIILFTMSYWLVSKAEAAKWSAYIKDKVQGSLSSGSMKALWFTSFLAVYREGAETVLFFQALTTDADATGLAGVAGGFLVGCVALGFVYWAMRAGALRLPIRPFFRVTGALLYAMAFVFAGKGIMELVEGKVLSPTLISWVPEVPALGVYPYWESLLPQVALVVAALVALVVVSRQRPAKAATVSGASAPESGRG